MIRRVFLGVLLAATLAPVAQASSKHSPTPKITPVIGQFDYFEFALSYEKDFCVSQPNRDECKPGTIIDGMGLHGLWPNRDDDPQHQYGFCDISEAQMGKDWCASQIDVKNKLSQEEYEILSEAMPGAKSCLYNHEWYAHGTCSGLSVEEYLMAASALTFQFRKLPAINQLIVDSAGKTLSRSDFLDAIEKDLGPGTRNAVTIECRHKHKTAYFSEIRFSLDREKYMRFPAQESLKSLAKPGGSCPADGIVVSP